MIKTEARKTWSDRVNFTLRNRVSWTFKLLKPMSFQEAALDPIRYHKNFHLLIKSQ